MFLKFNNKVAHDEIINHLTPTVRYIGHHENERTKEQKTEQSKNRREQCTKENILNVKWLIGLMTSQLHSGKK